MWHSSNNGGRGRTVDGVELALLVVGQLVEMCLAQIDELALFVDEATRTQVPWLVEAMMPIVQAMMPQALNILFIPLLTTFPTDDALVDERLGTAAKSEGRQF